MSNAKFDIEKFDGSNNFGMWQCEVMDLLFREGSDIALSSKPKDMSDEDWKYVNRQACGTIRLCLAKDQKYFVMKETMASSLWKKLEDKYMTKSIENRLYLKKKLFRFQYKKGISMIEHLDNYNKILTDLQNLDVEISDEDKALLLLNSLPDTYEHLTTTLLYGKDEVKFIDVSNALVNNEYRKKDQLDHRDSTSEALTVARGRTNNIRSRVPSERGKSHSKSRGASRSKPKGESAFTVLAFTVSLSDSHSDKWILDSDYSYHMCLNRQWFSSFQEFDGGVLLMGNNNTCQRKGIGIVRLTIHDGTIRQLTDVRYVLDLEEPHFTGGLRLQWL